MTMWRREEWRNSALVESEEVVRVGANVIYTKRAADGTVLETRTARGPEIAHLLATEASVAKEARWAQLDADLAALTGVPAAAEQRAILRRLGVLIKELRGQDTSP